MKNGQNVLLQNSLWKRQEHRDRGIHFVLRFFLFTNSIVRCLSDFHHDNKFERSHQYQIQLVVARC